MPLVVNFPQTVLFCDASSKSVIGRLETVQYPKPELDLVVIPDTTFTPAEDTAIVTLINFVLFSIISTTLSKTVGVGLEHCDPRLDISSLKNRIVKSDLHTTASHQQDRLEGQTSGGSHN